MNTSERFTKEWILAVAGHLNMSPSQLGVSSGVAASTITRYINDRSGQLSITQATLEKIAAFSGFRPGQIPGQTQSGDAPLDAIPLRDSGEPVAAWIQAASESAKAGNGSIESWVMKGAALDGLGILPGDVILIDRAKRPKSGEVVLVSIQHFGRRIPEMVMRVYRPPYLVTHSIRLGPGRPEQADEERVLIAGTMIGMLRGS
jgi:transcriptional regulator with XRE-family HTH domain